MKISDEKTSCYLLPPPKAEPGRADAAPPPSLSLPPSLLSPPPLPLLFKAEKAPIHAGETRGGGAHYHAWRSKIYLSLSSWGRRVIKYCLKEHDIIQNRCPYQASPHQRGLAS